MNYLKIKSSFVFTLWKSVRAEYQEMSQCSNFCKIKLIIISEYKKENNILISCIILQARRNDFKIKSAAEI